MSDTVTQNVRRAKLKAKKAKGKALSSRTTNPINPLKLDPSRTALLRSKAASEIKKRFARLRYEVQQKIVTEDALDLTTNTGIWSFLPSAEKLRSFSNWLEDTALVFLPCRVELLRINHDRL